MSEQVKVYEEIRDFLKANRNGVKARVIARHIGVEKKIVNRLLYSSDYGKYFRKDLFFRWYIRDEQKPSGEKPSKPSIHPLCKKCMVYKQNTCIGEKELCEFFKSSPEITQEEIDNWPKEMGGPYGTLHSNQKDH